MMGVNRVRYYPYGSVRDEDYGSGASELITDRLYTGQQRQAGSTIYHYGARFYNTATGRFIQADPIAGTGHDPQMLNRYAYVRNNPLRYSDPSGMKLDRIGISSGCGIQNYDF